MNQETRNRLIILVFAIIPVLIVVWMLPRGDDRLALEQAQRIGSMRQLERELQALEAQGNNYLERAPRNNDHYFRDVEIVFPNFLTHIDSLDASFAALGLWSESLPDQALAQLVDDWNLFRRGLDEQFGVDPEMPRMEWGARHIVKTVPSLNASLASSREALKVASDSSGPRAWLALTLAILAALSMSIWSWRNSTGRACMARD